MEREYDRKRGRGLSISLVQRLCIRILRARGLSPSEIAYGTGVTWHTASSASDFDLGDLQRRTLVGLGVDHADDVLYERLVHHAENMAERVLKRLALGRFGEQVAP
jgi:hypothetical protein